MAETVSTGGNVSFKYQKGSSPKLKDEEKKEIEQAYDKYYERKRKERKRKITITIVIIAIAILVALGVIFFKGS